MVPVSYIVTAIVSAAKKADEEEDKLFCEYLKGKKME